MPSKDWVSDKVWEEITKLVRKGECLEAKMHEQQQQQQQANQASSHGGCGACAQKAAAAAEAAKTGNWWKAQDIEQQFDILAKIPSDCNEHLSTIRSYVARSAEDRLEGASVQEHEPLGVYIDAHRADDYLVAALAGMAMAGQKKVEIITKQAVNTYQVLMAINAFERKHGQVRLRLTDHEHGQIAVGILDPIPHTKPVMADCLEQASRFVEDFLIIHDTITYGEIGEDSGVGNGIMPAIREFLKKHREWTAIETFPNNNGLLILAKPDRYKAKLPPSVKVAWNFAKSVAGIIGSGVKQVSEEEFQARVAVCDTCRFRINNRCGQCGCFIEAKAVFAHEQCPLGYWPDHS
jgi:hypothetical protein